MARPLRVDVEGGIYHVISRGTERGIIFRSDKDRAHFIDRLAEAQKRFHLSVHAYVLMDNHFHLIVCTPEANLSQAMQWLKVSYSMWFNVKYDRVGSLFQGRFKSILVDARESWLLELSFYIHLNPVRTKALGLDKAGRAAEGLGIVVPSADVVSERLALLRGFRWSSYPFYAGYRKKIPDWLDLDVVLSRVANRREYRKQVEYRICYGMDAEFMERLKNSFALGRSDFVDQVRDLSAAGRETVGKRLLRRNICWDDALRAVEKIKGHRWADFSGIRADWGRAAVCYLCRKHAGMTLREIGEAAGGMDYAAVSMMLNRFEKRLSADGAIRVRIAEAEEMLKVKT